MRCLSLILFFSLLLVPPVEAQKLETSLIENGPLDEELLSRLATEESNHFRVEHGRAPLNVSPALQKAASNHAKAMAQNGFFSHRNPVDAQQRTLAERMHTVGLQFRACGENIAYTFSRRFCEKQPDLSEHTYRSLARAVVTQWIDSKGHRENLLSRQYSLIGFGFSTEKGSSGSRKVFCVQTFAAPVATVASSRSFGLRRY